MFLILSPISLVANKPEHPEISSGELKDVLFRSHIKSKQLFAKHTATFNLKQGVHPAMARCRKQLGSNIDILTAMLDFDPRRRPTMRSLLMSPIFDSLRGGASKSAAGDSLHLFDAFKRDIFERPLPDVCGTHGNDHMASSQRPAHTAECRILLGLVCSSTRLHGVTDLRSGPRPKQGVVCEVPSGRTTAGGGFGLGLASRRSPRDSNQSVFL